MTKRDLAATALQASGLGWLLRRLGAWNGLVVVNYHRIGEGLSSRWDEDLYSATAEAFDAQLRYFQANFDVIHASEVGDVLACKRGRFLQVTFDDGYRDNFEVAFPLLRDNGISATFFIATDLVDNPRAPWWDELAWMVQGVPLRRLPSVVEHLARSGAPRLPRLAGRPPREVVRGLNQACGALSEESRLRFLDAVGEATGTGRCPESEGRDLWMTWDMVRALRRGGMTIGGHTMHHVELSRLSQANQLAEIAGSKARIETEIGEPVLTFSYPFGHVSSFDSRTRACLAETGIRFGYSFGGGYQPLGRADAHDLKRIAMEESHSWELLLVMTTLPQLLCR